MDWASLAFPDSGVLPSEPLVVLTPLRCMVVCRCNPFPWGRWKREREMEREREGERESQCRDLSEESELRCCAVGWGGEGFGRVRFRRRQWSRRDGRWWAVRLRRGDEMKRALLFRNVLFLLPRRVSGLWVYEILPSAQSQVDNKGEREAETGCCRPGDLRLCVREFILKRLSLYCVESTEYPESLE